ncbi:MAG TPA: malto-oligosyltrehalose trehalohydrolase [Ilumatobacteraceae bacterium]|nr:malto-oligosyltrehalose trehalohydrolase [Ilumatobacteraceae bacterium]
MHEFRVWAPTPRRVELVVANGNVEMCNAGGGWWSLRMDHAGPGTRYGFSLDGGTPRPDPRSASQPDGTDGLSELVDHTSFEWTDSAWRGVSHRGAVLYELHVGTFTPTGTFDAAIERIPHLVELGIDAIELLPVVEFSGTRGWGYDGVDLFAPHHVYGGPDGLKRLIDACHRHGIGVVLDVVYNHVGPAGNRLGEFGPYFSERHRTNWGDAVNVDGPGSDEVRRFVIDNALMWLRHYHVDGLRLDAVHAIVDESARHVLEEIAAEVDALAVHVRRPLFLIAECDLNDPRFVRSREAGGYGFDSAWADEWHHALHAALTNDRTGYYEDFGTLAALAKALRQAWVYDGIWSRHRQRHHGRSPAGLAGHQFVVCTQNHDQVGNRAAGERSSALMSEGRLRVAAALLLAGPFTPMLFHGEEWGATTPFQYFTDHRDPDLAAAVSRGRRDEFANMGWDPDDVPDPQALETFERSKLDWHETDDDAHAAMLAWYRELIALRRHIPALSDPRLDRNQVDVDENRATIVVTRGPVKVIVNLGVADHHFRFTAESDARILAGSDPRVRADGTGVVVPPDAVAVVQVGDA